MESREKCKTCPRILFPEELKSASWNWRGKRVWVRICDKCLAKNSAKQSFTISQVEAQLYDLKARQAAARRFGNKDAMEKWKRDKEYEKKLQEGAGDGTMPIAKPAPRKFGLFFTPPKGDVGAFFFGVFDNAMISSSKKPKKDGNGTWDAHSIATRCSTIVNDGSKNRIFDCLFTIQDNNFVDAINSSYPLPPKINPMNPPTRFMGKAFLLMCIGSAENGYNENIVVTNETLKDLEEEIRLSEDCKVIRKIMHDKFETDFEKKTNYPFAHLRRICWHSKLADYILTTRREKGADTIDGCFVNEDGSSDEIPF